MKVATKQGIGRTLNECGVPKMRYSHSKVVRGWSTQQSGWTSEETETGFLVRYVYAYYSRGWGTRGKTDQEIADHKTKVASTISSRLETMLVALMAKRFDASLVYDNGQSFISINNTTTKETAT